MENLKVSQLWWVPLLFEDETGRDLCNAVVTSHSQHGKVFVGVTDQTSLTVSIFAVHNEANCLDAPQLYSFPITSEDDKLVGLFYSIDEEQLVFCTALGSISTLSLETLYHDFVGNIPTGIQHVSWSSDGEYAVILTRENELVQMDRMFNVFLEKRINPTEMEAPTMANVGWGKKETQFHGSAGKDAAKVKQRSSNLLSDQDLRQPSVTWRSDAAYYALNIVDALSDSRVLLVFDSTGQLNSKSEPMQYLEGCLTWKPLGGLIASTQRTPEGIDVVFFEKNGLSHGRFSLRGELCDTVVANLEWNIDGSMLLVQLRDCVRNVSYAQVWTTANYHYYLKWSTPTNGYSTLTCSWDLEDRDTLFLVGRPLSDTASAGLLKVCFCPTIDRAVAATTSISPVAVIDGNFLHYTPFKHRHVPPPLSATHVELPGSINDVSICASDDKLMSILTDDCTVFFVECVLAEKGRFVDMKLVTHAEKTIKLSRSDVLWKSTLLIRKNQLLVVGYSLKSLRMCVALYGFCGYEDGSLLGDIEFGMSGAPMRVLSASSDRIYVEDSLGKVYNVDLHSCASVPEAVHWPSYKHFEVKQGKCFVLTKRHSLFMDDFEVSHNATSFALTGKYLVFTTLEHYLQIFDTEEREFVEKRRVERSSKIVTAVHDDVSVVLQHARGNLESVRPRFFVKAKVRELTRNALYIDAVKLCRKDRLDMNIVFEENVADFIDRVPEFVRSILPQTDYLNLFLTHLSLQGVVKNKVCRGIQQYLESIPDIEGDESLMSSLLTALACCDPPELQVSLEKIRRVKHVYGKRQADKALKYFVLLVDAKSLFREALGMYDFELSVMVAQLTQMDPREYLPFLKKFQAAKPCYQRYMIDDYLGKTQSALRNLILASVKEGKSLQEVKNYVKLYALFPEAIAVFETLEEWQCIIALKALWADEMEQRSNMLEAGLLNFQIGDVDKASECFSRAGEWEILLAVSALGDGVCEEAVISVLEEDKRYEEAAQCLECLNTRQRAGQHSLKSLELACMACKWLTAYRLASGLEALDLLKVKVTDALSSYQRDLEEMRTALVRFRERLTAVREQKQANLAAQSQVHSTNSTLDGVDLFSDTQSMASSVISGQMSFTLKSGASSSHASTSSRMTSKARRKMERKKHSDKKGGAFEEQYLVGAITKTGERFAQLVKGAYYRSELSDFFKVLALMRLESEGVTLQKLACDTHKEAKFAYVVAFDEPAKLRSDRLSDLSTKVMDLAGSEKDEASKMSLYSLLMRYCEEELNFSKEQNVKPVLPDESMWTLDILGSS